MKVTQILRAQHLGFMFKKHWLIQGRRTPKDSGAKAVLETRNLEVIDAVDFVKPVAKFEPFYADGLFPPPLPLDESHPEWSQKKCYTYDDSNVLLEGVEQAQILTKTVCVDHLPTKINQNLENAQIPKASDLNVRKAIFSSTMYDAEQKKLAIRKDPNRPAYNFPRDYGITDARRMRLILSKLVFECEKLSGRSTTSCRKIVNNVNFIVPFEKDGDRIRVGITADTFITSKKPIVLSENKQEVVNELPNLFPLKHTISMPQSNIYKFKNFYPIQDGTTFNHPHTILLHFSPLDVKNLHEVAVNETQFKARSLVKSFAVAAASARAKFGENVEDLPSPTVVQSVQTDGRSFYFGVFELNTLNLNGSTGTMNYWYHIPILNLYAESAYQSGKPVMTDYNQQVLKYFLSFYNNN